MGSRLSIWISVFVFAMAAGYAPGVRAAAPECGCSQNVAVPSYFYPDGWGGPGQQLWDRLETAYPTVRLAIINPNSGPGEIPNPDYARQVASSRAKGLLILGYVYTSYGARDPEQVKWEIDRYVEWYHVHGIFVDQVPTTPGNVPYYQAIREHVNSSVSPDVLSMTVLNPGTQTDESYLSAGDVIVTFEDTCEQYQNGYAAPAWVNNYPSYRFWHLVHAAGTVEQMQNAMALSKDRHAGWVYVTPDGMPNPWDSLPPDDSPESYWAKELAAARGDTVAPEVDAGEDVTVEQQSGAGTEVTLTGSATDNCDSTLDYEWSEGGMVWGRSATLTHTFGPGEHLLTLTVTDAAGNVGWDTVTVQVMDTRPPTINHVSATPAVLWPANHKMVDVTVTMDCEDLADPAPACRIVNVTANEPIDGPGDSLRPRLIDWEIIGDLTVRLRAERSGRSPRVYTLEVDCADASGNRAISAAAVTVPLRRPRR